MDLVLDRPYIAEMPEVLTLFHETGKLYFQLITSAKERKLPVFVEKYAVDRALPPALQSVLTVWEDTSSNKKAKPINWGSKKTCIYGRLRIQLKKSDN